MPLFKAYKKIYMYDLKHGFRITTLHVDGEFLQLQALIHKIPKYPRVNPASASEHVSETEIQI